MVLPVKSPSSSENDLYTGKRKKGQQQQGIHNLVVLGLCMVSFVAGSLWTTPGSMPTLQIDAMLTQDRLIEECKKLFDSNDDRAPTVPFDTSLRQRRVMEQADEKQSSSDSQQQPCIKRDGQDQRFPKTMKKFARGMARVSRENLTQTLDLGVPIDPLDQTGNEDVLFLYKSDNAAPNSNPQTILDGDIPMLSAETAMSNCDTLHVILTEQSTQKQCMAIVPQYPSMHIQRYARVPPMTYQENGFQPFRKVNSNEKLRLVGRGLRSDGIEEFKVATKDATKRHWKNLQNYFSSVERVTQELDVLAKRIARDNTVVVMVCNHGQSEILINFVCSARARNIDIGHVLLFATDLETKQLAESMGMTVYYDDTLFSDIPTQAAGRYGDETFAAMMMTKVYCVQLLSMLGYDLLFQDVDLIWYRDPVSFFKERIQHEEFDIYFQDDGARSPRYSPYSANSGFYYAKSNPKTSNFFNALLMQSDMILTNRSHQQSMIAVLSEHASLFGLGVKVIGRDSQEFPCGFQYHADKEFMKAMMKGETDQYIFHMSWTENKDQKSLFLKQMGEWYVKDQCVGASHTDTIEGEDNNALMQGQCCSAEPLFSCHFSDKPSKYPCSNSPPMRNGAMPFWAANEFVPKT